MPVSTKNLRQREQRMDEDLKAARKLQHVLQPREAPELRGLEIAHRARVRLAKFRATSTTSSIMVTITR